MRSYLQGREARALRDAETLDDARLLRELLSFDELARAGYSNADGLRQLAALSLTLARRLDDRAASHRR
jgi:hypothetical protein